MLFRYDKNALLPLIFVVTFFCASMTGIVYAAQFIWTRGWLNAFFIISRFALLTLGLLTALRHIKIKNLTWYVFIIIFFMILCFSGFWFPDTIPDILNTILKFFPIAFSTIILINIDKYDYLQRFFFFTSKIVTSILVLFIIFFIRNNLIALFASQDTYMLFSYTILPFSCCLFNQFLNKKSLSNFIFFFICATIMVLFGCRGAFLSLVAYALIIFLRNNRSKKKILKTFGFIVLIFTLIFIGFVFASDINRFFVQEFDIKSRLLRKLATSSTANVESVTTGRYSIYSKVINEIELNPFKIRGVNSDVLLLGGYCHNLFLEIIYDFGGILGVFFSVIIVALAFKTIFSRKYSAFNDMVLFFFAISFFKLLVSNSFFYELNFWCWLALSCKALSKFKLTYFNN